MMSYTAVLKVTDFTHITRFIYFMHIGHNSVVVVIVVVVVVVVRNGCCNDFFLK